MLLDLLGFALLAGQRPTDAEAALRRGFDRRAAVNVDAIVEKPFRGGDTMRIRMQYDASGRRRTEVLWPAAVKGRVFVDDGATWTVYNPDTHVVRVHPAPPEESIDARMALIHRNYRVTLEGKAAVAGRSTIVVVASPKAGELRTQRFYLDTANSTPLKIESIDAMGNVSVQFTARRVSYPGRMAKETFAVAEAAGTRRENGSAPVRIRSGDDVGFRLAMPWRNLPYGFRPQSVERMGRDDRSPVAVKLSDGLVRVLVFQSRVEGGTPPRASRPDGDPAICQDVEGVHIDVRGDDVPAAARQRILAAYVQWSQRGRHR